MLLVFECQENSEQSEEIKELLSQLTKLRNDHKALTDESSELHLKLTHERRVHTQVCSVVISLIQPSLRYL